MKKEAIAIWVGAAAFVAALVFVIRQSDGTATDASAMSAARGADELDRIVVLTPPNGCDGVAWGSVEPLLGDKGLVTKLLKTVGDIAKSPLGVGLVASNPKLAGLLDPAKARAKVREEITKELGFDPSGYTRVVFALCRMGIAAFVPRGAGAKAADVMAASRDLGEFVVVSKSKDLLDEIAAWEKSEKKVDHPGVAALRDVRGLRKGFGGETFGAFGFGKIDGKLRFRTIFAVAEKSASGYRLVAGGSGDEADLVAYEVKAKEAIAKYRGMIDRLPPQAAVGVSLVGGVDKLTKMVDGAKVAREGKFLTGAMTLAFDDFATVGMMSAIAIPAFVKYVERAKRVRERFGDRRDSNWTPSGEAPIVVRDASQLGAAVGRLVTLEGVVESSKIATLLSVDVASDAPDLRGEKAVATGVLRKLVVTQEEIDARTAKFGQFAHRGAGTFFSLVDPATGRLAQVRRP
ncbi:MAG: hypothetical protein HYY84_01735 [Deltaproteobacteria bacterium]|nr:hypothetical protein [Deltaproteobacteria bacterium]